MNRSLLSKRDGRGCWGRTVLVIGLLAAMTLGIASPVSSAQTTSAKARTVLIIGDSLSDAYRLPKADGWVALLADRLKADNGVNAHAEIINASISGETSAGGAQRLPSLLKDHEPDVVMILLGGNDGLRALHPDQLKMHLSDMIEASLDAGAEVGLMQVRLPPNLGPAYIERFEAVYPQLVAEHGITLLPFFLADIFDQAGMLMDDGIHPTAKAQPLMLDTMWPHVQALLAKAKDDS